MRRPSASLILVLAALMLVACAAPSPTATPATIAPILPTQTSGPIATIVRPTLTPVSAAPAYITLQQPGLNASVLSPLVVTGQSGPTFEQNLVIKISAQDGTVIATQPVIIKADAGQRGAFEAEVPYEIPADQPGRVAVMDISPKDGGLVHLTSVEVTLLAGGTAAAGTPPPAEETITITRPEANLRLAGGIIRVYGLGQPVFENQLQVALCGEGGTGAPDPVCGTQDNYLSRGVAIVQAAAPGEAGLFAAEIPYTVTQAVNARLAVYALSARDGGVIALNSIPLVLLP
jgi:hypothetical protein